jgi:hypothetical protein
MSLTVACVLSEGPGNYSKEHVQRLQSQVAEYLDQPYTFICLDDSPFPGFWAKISLFEPGRFSGRVLYLDLDVTIKGSLDELAIYDAPFAICKDWTRLGFNSSVMAWDAGTVDHIFAGFDYDEHSQRFKGDQSWIFHIKPDARKFPRGWVQSFKVAVMQGGFEPDLRVIAYHGWPRPWELEDYA